MKIVHLLPHFANDGNGVVYVATDLACAQSSAGHAVTCIGARGGSLELLLQGRAVVTHVIPEFGLHLVHSLLGLWRRLKTLRPQLVHAHTVPTALIAKLLQPFFGYSLVTSVHNGPRLKNYLLAVGDRIICVSAAVAQGIKLPSSGRKVRIVRNGPLGSPRRTEHDSPPAAVDVNGPTIVTMAGLHPHKGVRDLIEAFAIARKTIPDLSLYILGKGPEQAELQSLADRLACSDHVRFEGFVSDPRAYLSRADLFVLPSHSEAFGLSIAEAREAGCAVVGTNVGGIPEVLEDGRSGILVPARDPVALGRVLVELFSDRSLLTLWRSRASSNLSWLRVDRVLAETMAVYDELLRSKPGYASRGRDEIATLADQRSSGCG